MQQPAQTNTTNSESKYKNIEATFNKMLQTQMGKSMAPAYLNNQYKSGNLTEEELRKLAGKL